MERAVRAELRRAQSAESPGLVQSAIKLARTLDATSAARDTAALGLELRRTLADLAALAAAKPQEDSAVDDLAARRAARRSAAADL